MYDGVGSRFAPVAPEESLFFNINESDNGIYCALDIFELTNAGFYPLAADGNMKPDGDGDGGEPAALPERHWAAKVSQVVYVTLVPDPTKILADTDFSGIAEKYSESEIEVTIEAASGFPTDPMNFELRITRFEGSGNYIPPDDGTLTRSGADPSKWLYKSFKELKTEKHPEPVEVYIAPYFNNQEVGPEVLIIIRPVFFITKFHFPGPGSNLKIPGDDDKQTGVDFVIWKYGVGGGYTMEFNDAQAGGNMGYTVFDAIANNRTFIGNPALQSENITASVVGHEAIHRDQGYYWSLTASEAEQEEPAYKWELDNAELTGIDKNNDTYLQITEDAHKEYEQQLNP